MRRHLRVGRSGLCATALAGLLALPGTGRIADDDPLPPAARASVERALSWLVRAQNRDGSWGDDDGLQGEIGNTCIATLTLLGTGSTPTRGRYHREIRRALRWLDGRARGWGSSSDDLDRGTLLQRKLGDNIDLYLLTLLGSQLLGNDIDARDGERLQEEMSKAVDRIASLQKDNGEWEASYEPMLTTITAWLALRQAWDAGVRVPAASARKVVEYLKDRCFDPATGVFHDHKWNRGMRFVTQAGALRVLYGMGEGQEPAVRRATDVILKMRFDQDVGGREGGEEFLAVLFATQALHIERGAAFESFYPRIVAALAECQNADGSWVGHHCITGRVFCTSTAVLSMLTPNRLLPMLEK